MAYENSVEGKDLETNLIKFGIKTHYIDGICAPQEWRFNFSGGDFTSAALKRVMDRLYNIDGYLYERNPNGGFTITRQREKRQFISNLQANYELRKIVPDHNCAENNKCYLAFGMGANGFVIRNLDDCPHILIGGETGSGKSCLLNAFIMQLLCFSNANLILLDPKSGAEFGVYERDIHNRICHVAKDIRDSLKWLRLAYNTMEKRYTQMDGVTRHYDGKKIVVIIDELSDLMKASKSAVEQYISSIARKGRAAGVHLIVATQVPYATVLTGDIKYNLTTKICLQTLNATHSVTVLGQKGGEKLLGKGDALCKTPDKVEVCRIQTPYCTDDEIIKVITH